MSAKNSIIILFSKYRALMPYILAQSKLETANFTSKVFRENNNMFGMKLPRIRPTTATGAGLLSPEGNNYANYTSTAESLQDLFLWMDNTKFPLAVVDSEQYARELKQRNFYGVTQAQYLKNLNFWLT